MVSRMNIKDLKVYLGVPPGIKCHESLKIGPTDFILVVTPDLPSTRSMETSGGVKFCFNTTSPTFKLDVERRFNLPRDFQSKVDDLIADAFENEPIAGTEPVYIDESEVKKLIEDAESFSKMTPRMQRSIIDSLYAPGAYVESSMLEELDEKRYPGSHPLWLDEKCQKENPITQMDFDEDDEKNLIRIRRIPSRGATSHLSCYNIEQLLQYIRSDIESGKDPKEILGNIEYSPTALKEILDEYCRIKGIDCTSEKALIVKRRKDISEQERLLNLQAIAAALAEVETPTDEELALQLQFGNGY